MNSELSNTIEVLISDIDHDGIIRTGSKTREVPANLLSRIENFRLLPNDILISTKGTIGKAGLCDSEIPDNLYCGQTMAILRLDHSTDRATPFKPTTEYLFRYLLTPQVNNYLRSCAGGSSIQFIKAKDLLDLPVPVVSGVKQQRISELHYTILDHYRQAGTLSQEANKAFENTH